MSARATPQPSPLQDSPDAWTAPAQADDRSKAMVRMAYRSGELAGFRKAEPLAHAAGWRRGFAFGAALGLVAMLWLMA